MNASDDIDLLTAYAEKGDDAAFRQLVDKYAGMIYATAKRRTGDIEAAKEISQTTFAILARKAGSLKAHTSIGAWLHRTCVLESAKHLRSEYRHLRKMKALTDRERQVNEEHLWDRLEPCLDEAIERLPASDRQLIILRFIDGLKFREVGEKIGKTEEACRKQMGRALDRLSKVLSSQGTVISAAAIATGLAGQLAKAAPPQLTQSLFQTALSGAASISKTTLITNTLQTMTYSTLKTTVVMAVIFAAVVAVINLNGGIETATADDSNPKLVGSWPGYDRDWTAELAVAGNYAYLADGRAGLQVIDVSDPASPVRVGGIDTGSSAKDVVVSGNHAYMADFRAGLQIIDITDPAHPIRVGGSKTNTSSPDGARGVAVSGNYAYLADGAKGMQVIDISDPVNPVPVGGIATIGSGSRARAVEVAGNYAYVTSLTSRGTTMVDISDPANPVRVGSFDIGGDGIAVVGDRVYTSNANGSLQVLDISDPLNPAQVGEVEDDGNRHSFRGVAIAGTHAYVAGGPNTFLVIDVSDPANPVEVGFHESRHQATGVAVVGTLAYVADGIAGMQIIDVSDPANPKEAGAYDARGVANGVAVAGNYAYLAASDGLKSRPGDPDSGTGLEVIDISDRTNPVRVGVHASFGIAQGVAVSGNYAYLADGYAGLQVIDVSPQISYGGVGTNITANFCGRFIDSPPLFPL
jgi:RNA polymerase sigma factor (sigma-70 family)